MYISTYAADLQADSAEWNNNLARLEQEWSLTRQILPSNPSSIRALGTRQKCTCNPNTRRYKVTCPVHWKKGAYYRDKERKPKRPDHAYAYSFGLHCRFKPTDEDRKKLLSRLRRAILYHVPGNRYVEPVWHHEVSSGADEYLLHLYISSDEEFDPEQIETAWRKLLKKLFGIELGSHDTYGKPTGGKQAWCAYQLGNHKDYHAYDTQPPWKAMRKPVARTSRSRPRKAPGSP